MSTGSEWHTAMQHEIGAVRRELDKWHEDLRRQCREIDEVLDRMNAGSGSLMPNQGLC